MHSVLNSTLTLSTLAKPRVSLHEFATSNFASAHQSRPTPPFGSIIPHYTSPALKYNNKGQPPFSDCPSIIVHFVPKSFGSYCIPDRDLPGAHQVGGGRFGGHTDAHSVPCKLLSIKSSPELPLALDTVAGWSASLLYRALLILYYSLMNFASSLSPCEKQGTLFFGRWQIHTGMLFIL